MCVQYVRSPGDTGNDPQVYVYGKGWREDKAIEERLVATEPDTSSSLPTTFVDADHGGDKNTRKSTSGLVITWHNQNVRTLSQSCTKDRKCEPICEAGAQGHHPWGL